MYIHTHTVYNIFICIADHRGLVILVAPAWETTMFGVFYETSKCHIGRPC